MIVKKDREHQFVGTVKNMKTNYGMDDYNKDGNFKKGRPAHIARFAFIFRLNI